jgi:hypothetical protein
MNKYAIAFTLIAWSLRMINHLRNWWKQYGLMIAAPMATAFVQAYESTGDVLSVKCLEHDAMVALIVGLGILLKSPMTSQEQNGS